MATFEGISKRKYQLKFSPDIFGVGVAVWSVGVVRHGNDRPLKIVDKYYPLE